MSEFNQKYTVAILSVGDMGQAIAKVLIADGHRVVTSLEGRSERTRTFAKESGVEVLSSLEAIASCADLVLSVVPPGAALDNARAFATAAARQGRSALFVDTNAVSADTIGLIEAVLTPVGIRLVDMSIVGTTYLDPRSWRIYVSGPDASLLCEQLGQSLTLRLVDGPVGNASTIKMLVSGFFKGLSALFFELLVAGERYGIVEEQLNALSGPIALPELVKWFESFALTYRHHAARRIDELTETIHTIEGGGSVATMTIAAQAITARLAKTSFSSERSLIEMIERIANSNSFDPG